MGPGSSADSILLGPGAAAPLPYYEVRSADEQPTGNFVVGAAHAIRRRWFPIAVLGLLLGSAAGIGFWFLMETQYTAVAQFVVPVRENVLPVGDGGGAPIDFELKKRSQMQLITSPMVLRSALAAKNVVGLPDIKKFGDTDAAFAWLRPKVTVAFPSNAEIMELRVRCSDEETATELAKAIRLQYIEDQLVELQGRASQIAALKADLSKYREEYRRKKEDLRKLEESAGGRPPTPEELDLVDQRKRHLEERYELKQKLWSLNAALEQAKSSSTGEAAVVTDDEFQPYLDADETYKVLLRKVDLHKAEIADAAKQYSGAAYKEAVAIAERSISDVEKKMAERKADVLRGFEFEQRRSGKAATPAQLEQQIATFQARETHLSESITKMLAEETAGERGQVPYMSIEMVRIDVDWLHSLMDRIQRQLQDAELAKLENLNRQQEIGIRPNGEVFTQAEADERRKLMQSCAAGGAVFVAVSGLIVLFDLRRRRLNDTGDVSSLLQLNVLGTVPLLKGKGSKRLEESARLAEAVDGVAATLLCRTAGSDHRIVMISSALAGEGKTTLAANLATSLAAAGRRTLLLDFDLRRPMLHQVYQVPIGPGLGELLSSADSSDFGEYLHETMTENLWLIPAGARRQAALAALSDERVADLFREFKEHFEFVIVDGPPVLLVVDTRLVARHADGVVMSMLRDVSELPKIKAACQLLQSYRVQILGGVVIGAAGDVYYGYPPERSSSIA